MLHSEIKPHFRSVGLLNFRGFKNLAPIPLAPLTFLVGPNSSGKSSLFDALFLLSQSRFAPIGTFIPRWDGPLVDLGSYQDTVHRHVIRNRVTITVEADLGVDDFASQLKMSNRLWPYRIEYTIRTARMEPVGILDQAIVTDQTSGYRVVAKRHGRSRVSVLIEAGDVRQQTTLTTKELAQATTPSWARLIRGRLQALAKGIDVTTATGDAHLRGLMRLRSAFSMYTLESFLRSTERVSSGRGGPQRWYSTGATVRDVARTAGHMRLFDTIDPSALAAPDDKRGQRRTEKATAQLREELAAVLTRLKIANQINSSTISPYHTSIEVRDSVTGIASNLMEVGYGASQVLPVIRACLSPEEGPLFIEQPEIHLHPKAQGEIAELICDTSARRQVIVETHSVHMINRARLRVARQLMKASDVQVIYVSRSRAGSEAVSIPLDDSGDFQKKWPDGFFEERYEDTKELLRYRHAPKAGD